MKKHSAGSPRAGFYSYSSKGGAPSTVSSFRAPTSPASVRSWASGGGESQASVNLSKYSQSSTNKNMGEVRRLTDKELQEKRSKGLCFRCDDKWSMGHRCRRRELSVILMEDEDEEGSEEASSDPPQSPTEDNSNEVNLQSEVSLNSVVGLMGPKTMKLKGMLGEYEVIVQVDPGATHNFVYLEKVKELGLPITESGGFGVSLGNGETVKGSGVCENVVLQLDGGVVIKEDFLPLALGTTDVILGVQWLEKLGTVRTNWKSQIMQFVMGNNTITLVGDPSLIRSKISLKAMIRTIRKEKAGYWVEITQVERTEDEQTGPQNPEIPPFLSQVVQ